MTFFEKIGLSSQDSPGSLGIRAEPRLSLREGSFRSQYRDKIKREREIFPALLFCSRIILLSADDDGQCARAHGFVVAELREFEGGSAVKSRLCITTICHSPAFFAITSSTILDDRAADFLVHP
jgi:hypothetical protein